MKGGRWVGLRLVHDGWVDYTDLCLAALRRHIGPVQGVVCLLSGIVLLKIELAVAM